MESVYTPWGWKQNIWSASPSSLAWRGQEIEAGGGRLTPLWSSKPTVLHESKNNRCKRRTWADSLCLLAENQVGVISKSDWAPLRCAPQQEPSGKEHEAKRGTGPTGCSSSKTTSPSEAAKMPSCRGSSEWARWNCVLQMAEKDGQYPESDLVATLQYSQEKRKTYHQCSERRGVCTRRRSIFKQLAEPKHFISCALRLSLVANGRKLLVQW